LEEFYPKDVLIFRAMMAKHKIVLPSGVCKDLTEVQFDSMIDIALKLELLWENAIGKDWKNTIDKALLKALYKKM
jgi:3-deoxy-alpha-D-manno-octulosonate 8-oxidase